jgi:hypothetical protein
MSEAQRAMAGTRSNTCEECGDAFDPPQGGICARCGRLLCGTHLHGFGGIARQLLQRKRSWELPLCRRCVRRDEPTSS